MATLAPTATALKNPERWGETFAELSEKALEKKDQIVLSHDPRSHLNSNSLKARLMVSVRTLPSLSVLKRVLKERRDNSKHLFSDAPGGVGNMQPSFGAGASDYQLSSTAIWVVESTVDGRVIVVDASTGVVEMVIVDPKRGVLITSLMHAPFKGLINKYLNVVPIETPQDLLHVRESRLINTDYMWIGFSDGSVRLFPTSSQQVCEWDRSAQMAKGNLADIVFELPKFHKGAIIAITRSPCHEDDKVVDVSLGSRLSSSIHQLTAATSRMCLEGREHLSLVCTASEDSCIAVWDIKKIYRCLEEMKAICREKRAEMKIYNAGGTSFRADAVTFLVNSPTSNTQCTVRSTCAIVKIRPLFKLKGGVGGLRTLNWISTMVTTKDYTKPRDAVAMTRDPKESTAPKLIKDRRLIQTMTRWERREEHRRMLRLSEREMRDVERELETLMPPLAEEPVQSRRINLIVAGDVHGTVHLWDLDEELELDVCEGTFTPCTSTPRLLSPVSRRRRDSTECERLKRNFSFANQSTTSDHMCHVSTTPNGTYSTPPKTCNSIGTPRTATNKSDARLRRRSDLHNLETGPVSSQTLVATPRHAGRDGWQGGTPVVSPQSGRGASKRLRTPSRPQWRSSGSWTPTVASTCKSIGLSTRGTGTRRLHDYPSVKGQNGSTSRRMKKVAPSTPRLGTSARESIKTPRSCVTSLSSPSCAAKVTPAKNPDASERLRGGRSSFLNSTTPTTKRRNTFDRQISPSGGKCADTGKLEKQLKRRSFSSNKNGGGRSGVSATDCSENYTSYSRNQSHVDRQRFSPTHSGLGRCVKQGSLYGYADSGYSPLRRNSLGGVSAGHRQMNDLYTRKAKFTEDLVDGGSVTGIVADLPPVITVTMRQLPDPPEPHYSLLEKPTAEEMERRVLANTFDELTNDRALFYVFKKLRFYVSVEGTIMRMQCIPKSTKSKGKASLRLHSPARDHGKTDGDLTFNIVFQQRILEKQPHPITLLFNDQGRSQLWIARNDGLLSVLSTVTDKIVTRVPHPSADTPLGPPGEGDCRRRQTASMVERGRPLTLEAHRKHTKYSVGHFVNFIPISVLQQFHVLRVSRTFSNEEEEDFLMLNPLGSNGSIAALDDRRALDGHARTRELNLSKLLQTLRQCRMSAVSVRGAQRDYYNSLFNSVSDRVGKLIAYSYAVNRYFLMEKVFRGWLDQHQHFRRKHVLRGVHTRKMAYLSRVAALMADSITAGMRRMLMAQWISFYHQTRIHVREFGPGVPSARGGVRIKGLR
uniref:Uncharacterized protein n=1 Tax=Trypanosoma congolense (strain IL3000) TaxID=1068625 RepID=G0UWH6_TRYCI|nr:conserved hypothetical protein [Trypanosoma congolense IL3000]